MRRALPILAVGVQVLILAYMGGEREWVYRTGETVWLRTAPVDPRDVMRGDYVRLDYEISRLDRSLWRDGLTNRVEPAGYRGAPQRVYASLRTDPDGLAAVTALSDRRPAEGLVLRGWLDPARAWGGAGMIRYGLEAFFMEQGRAKELEDQRMQVRRGVPLNMEVAVGGNGIGVLKGYRWEALGIALEFEMLRATNREPAGFRMTQNRLLGVKVELKNHGPEPVAIVDLPNQRSFGLLADGRWMPPTHRWVGEGGAAPAPEAAQVIVLAPGESHTNRLDLTRPEWFVVDIRTNAVDRSPAPLHEIDTDWNTGFRLEYRPPSAQACAHLAQAKLVWHGRLRSRWFNPMGSVD